MWNVEFIYNIFLIVSKILILIGFMCNIYICILTLLKLTFFRFSNKKVVNVWPKKLI